MLKSIVTKINPSILMISRKQVSQCNIADELKYKKVAKKKKKNTQILCQEQLQNKH